MDRPALVIPKLSVEIMIEKLKLWTHGELPCEKYPLCDLKSVTEFFARNLIDFQKAEDMKIGTCFDIDDLFRYKFFTKMKNFNKIDLILLCTYNSIYDEGQNIIRDEETIVSCMEMFDEKMMKLMAPRILDFCASWGPEYKILSPYIFDVIDHLYFKIAYNPETMLCHGWRHWSLTFGYFAKDDFTSLPKDLCIFLEAHPKFFLCFFSAGPDNKKLEMRFPKIYPMFRILFDKYYGRIGLVMAVDCHR